MRLDTLFRDSFVRPEGLAQFRTESNIVWYVFRCAALNATTELHSHLLPDST